MKRTDIRAGVVYAVKSSYGPPSPIVFLEDGAANVYSRGNYGRGAPRKLPADYKAKAGRGFSDTDRGYAAIRRNNVGDLTSAEAAERLADIDTAAELGRFVADENPAVDGLRFEIVTSLGQITGLYDEELAAYEAQQEADRAAARRREDERAAKANRAGGLMESLSEYGIRVTRASDDEFWLSYGEAEKIIALLAAKEA